MQKKSVCLVLGAILTLVLSLPAKAGLVYSVGFTGPTNVRVGSTFSASIYLQEVVTGGSTTVLGNPTQGIAQGNFLLNRTLGTSVDITGVALTPKFDLPGTTAFDPTFASGTQGTLGFLRGRETFSGSGIYQLKLGKITMTATSTGSTTFTSADFNALLDDLVLGDVGGTVLDGIIPGGGGFGGHTINVTAAPEPTTMGALGAFGAIGAAISYYRRRKQKLSTPTTTAA